MTAVAIASVQTGFRPDSSSPGFWAVSLTHGPSPPATVAYRRTVADMLQRYHGTQDPNRADAVGYLAALRPIPKAKVADVLTLARTSVAQQPNSADYLETLGAVYYRAGRDDDAITTLRAASDKQGAGGTSWTQFFLAMAHQRRGDRDDARRWLQIAVAGKGGLRLLRRVVAGIGLRPDGAIEAATWLTAALPRVADAYSQLSWQDCLIQDLLRREAEALLRVPP
jgi:predicted Zn-dependent protease